MSRLKLYRPDGLGSDGRDRHDEPVILSFARSAAERRASLLEGPLGRARSLHANRRCVYCRHPVVEPIELLDGVLDRSGLPIPGTATLVGFRCERCRGEWPAQEADN